MSDLSDEAKAWLEDTRKTIYESDLFKELMAAHVAFNTELGLFGTVRGTLEDRLKPIYEKHGYEPADMSAE